LPRAQDRFRHEPAWSGAFIEEASARRLKAIGS